MDSSVQSTQVEFIRDKRVVVATEYETGTVKSVEYAVEYFVSYKNMGAHANKWLPEHSDELSELVLDTYENGLDPAERDAYDSLLILRYAERSRTAAM